MKAKDEEDGRKEAPPAPPTGILRTESGKSRRASLDFKLLKQSEPASPQPSADRVSVTFAEDSARSDSSKCNFYFNKMDKVHFPENEAAPIDSDEEDYSASVHAIIQRKASTRKSRRRSSRRASSPFSPDIILGNEGGRRRSSVFTTSSGDTAITMDENIPDAVGQDEIFENIKLHKEVLSSVKMQPWNMRKKLKLVEQAKTYIKRHEGALQERLAQSRSTRDMLARCHIYLIKRWQRFRRELINLSNWFIPWERKIKEIESHFGSVVASYFTFLRWLFWVNVVLAVVLISFVAVPEILTSKPKALNSVLREEKYNSTNFQTLWDFEGIFRYSPLFYGWYSNVDGKNSFYRMPFAYFITGLIAYAYSFFATLRKMAENSRMSKLSEKDDECIFSWKLFTAWDYMIGNAETAHNRIASIVVGFKEALLEEAEKKREARNWKITAFRILVNTIVLGLLLFSAFAVVMVVKRSTEPEARSSVWRSNEITFVMTFISLLFPMLFEGLGFLEQYHPRKQLRLQLARIMVLNLLNLYSLIFALFDKINDMTYELNDFKTNLTNLTILNCNLSCDLENELPSDGNLAIASTISLTAYPLIHKLLKREIFKQPTTPSDEESYNDSSASYPTDTYLDFLMENLTEPALVPSPNDSLQENSTDDSVLSTEFLTTDTPTSFTRHQNCANICVKKLRAFDLIPSHEYEQNMSYKTRKRFRSLCWETMFGQELIKLTVMDLVMTIVSTMAMDFLRGIFVRVMNQCWCWDLEKKFPQYADFKVAENILHLVNNQGMVWMGMFFSPGLIPLNVIKLFILMYFRGWTVLTCNIPHEIIFRASRSNNFYYALLLMMLFLCVLPVGYAIVWVNPSFHCGPFTRYSKIFHIFTRTLKNNVPKIVKNALDYIASASIVIPLLLLMVLVIYYLLSLTAALREANNDLKIQLRRERTEERRKMFQIADRRRRGGSGGSGEFATPFAKWKKLMGTTSTPGKSFDDTSPRQETNDFPPLVKEEKDHKNTVFSKFLKKVVRKASLSDDGTDTEQHESLPEDLVSVKETRSNQTSRFPSFDLQKTAVQKRNSKGSEGSKKIRQDSESSVWSDNIPVITISKTESAECLDVVPEVPKEQFKPKIKSVLMKQNSQIDEDVICHFGKDLELKAKEEQRRSESDESEVRDSSIVTVVNIEEKKQEQEKKISASNSNDSTTESSAEYNDVSCL